MKNEILCYAMDFCKKENAKTSNKNIEYQISEGDAQIHGEDFSGGYDIRLDDEVYRNHSFTVIACRKNDLSILAQTTIFVTGYDIYKDVYFWRVNGDQTALTKVGLGDYQDLIGDFCVTIGYTQIADTVRLSPEMFFKYKTVLTFYNFAKDLVLSPRNFVHLEPSGLYYISNEILACDELVLADSNIDLNTLGEVDPESMVAAKMAERFKMHKVDNLYHDTTLGPVYFSKTR